MERTKYNEYVQSWMQSIQENCMLDAELTLKLCNDVIEYGNKIKDDSLIAFGYYYCGVVYYVLNDGTHFFEAVTSALSYLSKVEEWEMISRCYNFLGITSMNRGNAVIAADYYTNAVEYSKRAGNENFANTIAINIGALNIICGRYEEAVEVLMPVYEYFSKHKDAQRYQDYMLALYQNLAKANLYSGRLKEAKSCFDTIHTDFEISEESYVMGTVLCAEAMYYHIVGDDENCEKNIARIHKSINTNVPVMDTFDDYYDYCKVLLDRDKQEEFWHIIETLEPLIKNLDFTNLQLKLISLKIKYYRKYGNAADYLQAAGLYYELSERAEIETRNMMNNVLTLRKNLEKAQSENQKMVKENRILLARSETDPLTQLNNRLRLNDYSEEIFEQCLENNHSLAVEILDIDDFKGYNDTYGHQMGDDCLVQVAQALKSMEKEHKAFVARYGGDEFMLIYTDITREQAIAYAQELRQKVMAKCIPYSKSKVADVVTISQGICWDIPKRGNRMWDYLHAADDMLYRVKKKQRNNYCVGNLKEIEEEIVMSC
ncbi:MAG: GGDEF domain-containing protein [Agathobacter sp.]